MKKRTIAALVLLAALPGRASEYTPSPENLQAREWFQDAKFGLFIHWGVYSVLGDGEWVMNQKEMTKEEYEKLPPQFNPTDYDPAAWVKMAKDAGMRYITITSKHHDGFAMWETKQSPWNIVDATPYGKDLLKALAEECRKQDMKLFFYHSHLDWYHNDYYPRGWTGKHSGRPEEGDFDRYLDLMDAQLEELLTGYGPIAGIWFDGMWDRKDADWRLQQTYDLIHRLQPAALIGNNHHLAPNEGEDFQMFEKDLPGHNKAGYSPDAEVGDLPLETCETINKSWGYNKKDDSLKSVEELIHYLVRSAGYNANFLLNVGPKPDGTIQREFTERLAEMGAWLRQYGESIYGTRGGPMAPRSWGVSTQNDTHIFVHVLDWPDALLPLPAKGMGRNPRFLDSGEPVAITEVDEHLILRLPDAERSELNTVIVFEK